MRPDAASTGHSGQSRCPSVAGRARIDPRDCASVTVPSVPLEALIAEQRKRKRIEAHRWGQPPGDELKGGRPRADDRACFEGVLWVLLTGLAGRGWKNLPDKFPSPATCWRRLAEWRAAGVWLDALWGAVQQLKVFESRPEGSVK